MFVFAIYFADANEKQDFDSTITNQQSTVKKPTKTETDIKQTETKEEIIIYEDEYENEKIDVQKLFETFLNSQNKLVNHTVISFNTGISMNNLPDRLGEITLPVTQPITFEYGFVRIDSIFRLKNLRSYSSEYAFIENNSNDFSLFHQKDGQTYNNNFGFGVGLRSGYGTKLSNKNELTLYWLHSTAFVWTYFDYAMNPQNIFFNTFDEQYKFGNKGSATLSLKFTKNCFVNLEYEHNNMYSGMDYWKWGGSWFIDLILQRGFDLLDPVFVKDIGYAYPFVKFFYKNAISILLSEIRNTKQFYPFNSDYSLLERRLILKLKFIF